MLIKQNHTDDKRVLEVASLAFMCCIFTTDRNAWTISGQIDMKLQNLLGANRSPWNIDMARRMEYFDCYTINYIRLFSPFS